MANIAVKLWGRDLLQQWNTQINIPAVSETDGKRTSSLHLQRPKLPGAENEEQFLSSLNVWDRGYEFPLGSLGEVLLNTSP